MEKVIEVIRCYACSKVFQLAYTYQACKPGVKEQIIDMAMNNSGIRDTARVLKVATATVMKTFKNSPPERDDASS